MTDTAPAPYADPYRAARLLLKCRRDGVTDDGVLRALEAVDRSAFARPEAADLAYEDCDLPIPCGQTLHSPIAIGQLLQALQCPPDRQGRVLIVGAGTGFTMALAGELSAHVAGIERYLSVLEIANERLAALETDTRFTCFHGDGLAGLGTGERYDRILLTGTVEEAPKPLLDILAEGGRLVAPIPATSGTVLRTYRADGATTERAIRRRMTPLVPGPARRL